MTGQINEWRKWNMMMHRGSFACRLTREGKWGKKERNKVEDRIFSSFFSTLYQRKRREGWEEEKGVRRNRRGWKHTFYPWINTCIWARFIWCVNFFAKLPTEWEVRLPSLLSLSHYLLFSHLLATSLSSKDQVLGREGRGFSDDRKWWREWLCSKL